MSKFISGYKKDLHGGYPFPASALPISLEEDGHARGMRRTLKGADAALARLIVRIGAAGMIGHIQHLGDARGHPLDFRCHPLFQGHVRHATSLASPFEPDIDRIVLDI